MEKETEEIVNWSIIICVLLSYLKKNQPNNKTKQSNRKSEG